MRRSALFLSLFAVLAFASFASAQSVTTDPVGFTSIACPANSDTYLSVAFTRPPEFTGLIASVSGNTLTISGTPGWNNNQFVYAAGSQPKTYYALIGPHASVNPNEGRGYTITSNGSNTLTVNLNGDDISGVQANTQVLILPYATLASVFPAADQNVSFVPSPSQFNRLTQILIPNFSGNGINLSTAATYYFLNGAWRKFGQPTTDDHGDDVLLNTGYFLLRNAGTATNLTTLGSVLVKKETIPLFTSTSSQQDNFVSVTRPVPVSLDNLGLISSGAFASSPSQFNRIDQLFVFDNNTAAINKSAAGTYYYANSHWRKFGQDPTADFGTDTIPAGSGFVIRKGVTANGATQYWQNAPTY
jgi:uncharacterized protein (TIGR02597 family)